MSTHCERVLAVLADGKPHSTSDLHRRAGNMIIHSRISELRKRGHNIVCEHVPGRTGATAYRYTWTDAPPLPPAVTDGAQLRLTTDEIAPRDERNRYRVYRVRNGGAPEILATAADEAELGTAILTMGRDGEFEDTCLGVQDVFGEKGKQWVVKPWQAH